MRYISFILILVGHLFFVFGCKEEPVAVPSINSFTPLSGRIDTEITITGTNFSEKPAYNTVRINGVECPILSASENTITIKAVSGVSTGKISVTIGNLAALSFNEFVVKAHTITAVSPGEGVVGDEITITGSNYGNSMNEVKLFFYDSIPADIYDYHSSDATDTIKTFKTKVPENAATGKITIWFNSLATESETDFTVLP
jgi:hypothetical protein